MGEEGQDEKTTRRRILEKVPSVPDEALKNAEMFDILTEKSDRSYFNIKVDDESVRVGELRKDMAEIQEPMRKMAKLKAKAQEEKREKSQAKK